MSTAELLPVPSPVLAPNIGGGIVLPKGLGPEALVANYSAAEWENFILEVAEVWKKKFLTVSKLGGTNDGGLDICGFYTDAKLLGDWVCFQCKHYESDLQRNQVLLEIAKIFEGVHLGKFIMPVKYYLVSPKGVKSTFDRIMKNPVKFRSEFKKFCQDSIQAQREFKETLKHIDLLSEQTDFSIFETMSLKPLMDTHRESPYHVSRFGLPLPHRPAPTHPPDEITEGESKYIEKLLSVYQLILGYPLRSVQDLPMDSPLTQDLARQRYRFYSAESLRLFTRDKLPAHAFEQLVDEVYYGVIDTVEEADPGMSRVRAAMNAAARVSPAHSPLIAITQVSDKQGVCHQLAAAERLEWVVNQ